MSHTDKTYEELERSLMMGYLEMSEINLEEANICPDADYEALRIYEERMTECEEE